MKQILLCCFLIANLFAFALRETVAIDIEAALEKVQYIYDQCQPGASMKWARRVRINGMVLSGKRWLDSSEVNDRDDNEPDDLETEEPPSIVHSNEWYVTEDISDSLSRLDISKSNSTEERPPGLIETLLSIPLKLAILISENGKKVVNKVCSVIPEPIELPDLKLMRLLKFKAFEGRISGIRQLCQGLSYIPMLKKKEGKYVIRHEVNLDGLHFHYHVIDTRLRLDHTFNWTLGTGSVLEFNIWIGHTLPCVLKIEDLHLGLNFDRTDGSEKCKAKCNTVLRRMLCYMYHTLRQAAKIIIEPFRRAAKDVVCVNFKQIGLEEV